MSSLLTKVERSVAIATLNRPDVLNVIDLDLIDAFYRELKRWEDDPSVGAVVVRGAGTRAFCAGGDIRAVWEKRGDREFMDMVYRNEYILDDYIKQYPKPYIALMSGIVMGGGCGLSVHGRYRVVTESTVLAMPECKIGLFPDVAGSYFLSRCPNEFGMYLGLTGLRVGGSDAIRLGLADYFVSSARLDELVDRIGEKGNVRDALEPIVEQLEPSSLAPTSAVQRIFGGDSVATIIKELRKEETLWAREALAAMEKACPFSLELTFRTIRGARKRTMRECLVMDFRIATRLMERADYFEGVRALIIDKDNKPRWKPRTIEEVDGKELARCFESLANELRFEELR